MATIKFGLEGGRYVYIEPDRVDVSELTLADLAKSMGRLPRFGGHTPFVYSVARHSVILADWLYARGHREPDLLREAMLHDAPEALGVNDVQRFVKLEYGAGLKKLELRLMTAVYARFIGPVPPWVIDPLVDGADKRLGALEAAYFGWDVPGGPVDRYPDDPVLEFEFRDSRLAVPDADEWLTAWHRIGGQ